MKYYQTMKLNHVGNEFRYVSPFHHNTPACFCFSISYIFIHLYNKNIFNYIIYTICIYTYIYKKQQKIKKIIKNIMYIEHITNKNKTKDASQKRRHIIHHIYIIYDVHYTREGEKKNKNEKFILYYYFNLCL